MVALIEKIIKCLVALITYVAAKLTEKYPLWLYIVVCLAAVLFYSLGSCARDKSVSQALVGSTIYHGHEFLIFKDLSTNETLAVIHSPDCVCNYVEPLEIEE